MTLVDDIFILEPLKEADAESLSRLMIQNGRRFQKFLPKTLEQNLSTESSRNYIKIRNEEIENNKGFTFGIKDSSNNLVVGLIILKEIDWIKKDAEIAYCIGAKYEGRGWVSQSVIAFKDFAFYQLKLSILHIIIHKSNTASIKVATNSGFAWKRTLPNEFLSTSKGSLDMELYEFKR